MTTHEQILELAEEQGAVANLKQHFNMAGDSIVFTPEELEAFYHAAIQQHRDSLIKDMGGPAAYMTTDEEGSASMLFFDRAEALKYSGDDEPVNLFAESQLQAAVAKKDEEIERLESICAGEKNVVLSFVEDVNNLRQQLAAAQEANEHWQRATAENENKWIEANDKLAKAEQRVAEAIWKAITEGAVYEDMASGQWRKFVKEGE